MVFVDFSVPAIGKTPASYYRRHIRSNGRGRQIQRKGEERKMKNGKLGGIVLGVVLAAGLIVGIKCMERVPAGYVGVVYNFSGGISDQVLTQGWHFVSPTKKSNYIFGWY